MYKRRIQSTILGVDAFFHGTGEFGDGQINREITYFRDYYRSLEPACLIIYDRMAYYEPHGDLRLTIDHNPRYRTTDLNLTTSMQGCLLLPAGYTILEVKVQAAMPLWLTHILSQGQIYKGSFSKYGESYKQQTQSMLQQLAA